jgi:uncharacterized membrane protein
MNMTGKEISNNKSFRINEEYVFVVVALLFGILFVFLNPPFQLVSEDGHFLSAFVRSEGQIMPEKSGEEIGFMMPRSLIQTSKAFQGINFAAGEKISQQTVDNYAKIKLNKNERVFYRLPEYRFNPIAYIPNMAGITAGKIFNSNTLYLLWSSRIAGLVFYIIIVFFAIRIIPFFKGVLLLFAVSPMALYQAVSISPDSLSLSLSFLIFAMILKMTYNYGHIEAKDIIWLVIACFFHRFAGDGYYFIPFLILMVSKSKFKNPITYYLILAYFVLLIFLPGLSWDAILSNAGFTGGAQVRTDFMTDSSKNLGYQLSHPFQTFGNIFMNVCSQGKSWLLGSFGNFGYAGAMPSQFLIVIHILVILTVALFNGSRDIILTAKIKYTSLIIGIISLLAVMMVFLISGSPVGSNVIYGLRGVYFIPVMPLLILVIYNNAFRNDIFDKYSGLILGVYSIIILSIIAGFINSYFYAG